MISSILSMLFNQYRKPNSDASELGLRYWLNSIDKMMTALLIKSQPRTGYDVRILDIATSFIGISH